MTDYVEGAVAGTCPECGGTLLYEESYADTFTHEHGHRTITIFYRTCQTCDYEEEL